MSVPTAHAPARLIFGREPAMISAAIMAVVGLISGFWLPVSSSTQALIQTLVGAALALWVCLAVRENIVPGILAVVQAVLPPVVVTGADLTTDEQGQIYAALTTDEQGQIYAAAAVLLGLLARTNLTPKVPALDGQLVVEGEVVELNSAGLASEVANQIGPQLDDIVQAIKDGQTIRIQDERPGE
ncbi:membrane protein [Gordonia phage Vasanti]|uniref:Membrane protein n=1 Tax=Gordonia phage Vasanti TaxID=2502431 RepID=A0A411BVX0_9CAUD|nr:holin [Gordonia phage Vasanti]QAY05757.1 membrane protein [Gordonia phage Vasanti]